MINSICKSSNLTIDFKATCTPLKTSSLYVDRFRKIYDENGNTYQIISYEENYSFDCLCPEITIQMHPTIIRPKGDKKSMGSIGLFYTLMPKIEKVIFNPPATVILWNDGSKTVVKTQKSEIYDAEKGLAMAFMRKFLNNKDYHKYLEEAQEYEALFQEYNDLF